MTKTQRDTQDKEFHLEIDNFVPLLLDIGDKYAPKEYIRFVDVHNHVEIGISPVDGSLASIELVLLKKLSNIDLPQPPSRIEEKIPQFNLNLLEGEKFFDIEMIIEVGITDCSIIMMYDKTKEATIAFKYKELTFAVTNDGYPCWTVFNLTEKQVALFKKSIEEQSFDLVFPDK